MTLFGCCLSRLDSSLLSAPHIVSEWIVIENLSLIVVKFSPSLSQLITCITVGLIELTKYVSCWCLTDVYLPNVTQGCPNNVSRYLSSLRGLVWGGVSGVRRCVQTYAGVTPNSGAYGVRRRKICVNLYAGVNHLRWNYAGCAGVWRNVGVNAGVIVTKNVPRS